ncbi:hypothetical protein X797_000094, partial [Metarhizium robertsii]
VFVSAGIVVLHVVWAALLADGSCALDICTPVST